MAKPKTEPSAIMKAAEAARNAVKSAKEALGVAKEKLAKADTAPNKTAVTTLETKLKAAEEARDTAVTAENRERFENVGGGRVAKLLVGLKNLKGVANRRTYEFSTDDVTAMFDAIAAETKATRVAFDAALAASSGEKKTGAPKEKFTFKKPA